MHVPGVLKTLKLMNVRLVSKGKLLVAKSNQHRKTRVETFFKIDGPI